MAKLAFVATMVAVGMLAAAAASAIAQTSPSAVSAGSRRPHGGAGAFDLPLSLVTCDGGLPSDSTDAMQFARAIDLCDTTTDAGSGPGVISATLTQSSGTGTPSLASHALRSSFGANVPLLGASMVVLSTGAAAAPGQSNPSFNSFQPGLDIGAPSTAPADWLAANGNAIPAAPGCPPAIGGITANNSSMLTLRIRVPADAHSFSLSANFFAADFPEYVCSGYNDVFVALLDSGYAGVPANPADKNLATYFTPSSTKIPMGVNLATGDTGLFTQCANGTTGCGNGAISGSINSCVSMAGLAGTSLDASDPGSCNGNSLVGGATGWLVIRGNVVPGETITLRLAIWDTADGLSDSVVLLDNFSWSPTTATPGVSLN